MTARETEMRESGDGRRVDGLNRNGASTAPPILFSFFLRRDIGIPISYIMLPYFSRLTPTLLLPALLVILASTPLHPPRHRRTSCPTMLLALVRTSFPTTKARTNSSLSPTNRSDTLPVFAPLQLIRTFIPLLRTLPSSKMTKQKRRMMSSTLVRRLRVTPS